MWTLKIAFLAAGVTLTALMSNSAADDARCAAAFETTHEMTQATAAAGDNRAECLPNE